MGESGLITNTVAGLLSAGTDFVTWVASSAVSIASTVVETPLFAVGIGLFLAGAAISFVVRMIRIA